LLKRLPDNSLIAVSAFYRSIRNSLSLLSLSIYDIGTYHAAAGCFRSRHRGPMEARLFMLCHAVEKGLSLPEPRPGFGNDLVRTLLMETSAYLTLHGGDSTTRMVLNVLAEYFEFNKTNGNDLPDLRCRLDDLAGRHGSACLHGDGGSIKVTRQAISEGAALDFAAFLNSRHSIRRFASTRVSLDIVASAVRMAQRTPSVCNRQSGCVFLLDDPEKMQRLLALQKGSRGFAHQIDRLLIVTSRMDTFLSAEERHQQWIDGGMFAMTLVYSLHSLGIGSCCLNWEVGPSPDRTTKRALRIPAEHAIVMLIAIGTLPDDILVTQSPRRALETVFFTIGPDE
jgi:nitroreductase